MVQVQIFLVAAVIVTAIGAWVDWRTGEIPGWLTLGALVLAPLAHAVLGGISTGARGALEGFFFSVLGAVACGVIPLFLYRMGAMLGGDVKLLAALGAICRPMIGVEAEFYAFIAAALYAPARLAYEGKLLRTLGNTVSIVVNPFLPKTKRRKLTPEMMTWLRLGPSIFAGTAVAALLHWRTP